MFAPETLSGHFGRSIDERVGIVIRKTEKLLITFYTTASAMHMEQICKEERAEGRLIPIPGFISADCGLGWCAKLESEFDLSVLMERNGITPQGVYHCLI